ncbi:MAG: hypothetical protein QM778_22850 [Myxococcales bacterium]
MLTLRVFRQDAPDSEIAGTWSRTHEEGSHYALLAFTPTTPLVAGVDYGLSAQGQVEIWADSAKKFQLAQSSVGAGLDAVMASETWDEVSAGSRYSCHTGIDHGGCALDDQIFTTTHVVDASQLEVEIAERDGWLFAASSMNTPQPLPAGWTLALTASARVPLKPGVQSCVTLVARNVYDGHEERRQVCLTGSIPGPERENAQLSDFNLASCLAPPSVDGGDAPAKLLADWCHARAAFCLADSEAGYSSEPAPDCDEFEHNCDVQALEDEIETLDMDPEQPTQPVVPKRGPVADEPPQESKVGAGACSLGPNAAHARQGSTASLVLLGVLVWLGRRRLAVARGPARAPRSER